MVNYTHMDAFDVTYRGKDGKQETVRMEAQDRKGVFDELARRGISAIKVDIATGKVKPFSAGRERHPQHGVVRIVAWGVVGLLVATAAFFLAKSAEKTGDSVDPEARMPKPDSKAIHASEKRDVKGPLAPQKTAKDIAQEFSAQAKEFIKKAVTNETQWIVPPLDPNDPDNALRTRVCQELGSLLSVEPGEPMPPFPYSFLLEDDMREAAARGEDVGEIDNGNKSFLEGLAKFKIVAKETDDEHRLDHKEKLLAAQSELLESIDEGLSVNDVIRSAYEFRKRAYEVRTELTNLLRDIAAEGEMDIDTFKEQLKIANGKLHDEGIKAIPLEEILPEYEGDSAESTEDGGTN